MPHRTLPDLLAFIRDYLGRDGGKGLRNFGRILRALPSFDGSNKVNRNEFVVVLHEQGMQLAPGQLQMLFDEFDLSRDGQISFDRFLSSLRGIPSEKRQALIDKSFLKFDRDGNGYIDSRDLQPVYNSSLHPKVQQGLFTEEQAFRDFLSNFNDRKRDGRISRDEWNEYYAAVSFTIQEDGRFVTLMKTVWRLD
jgi:Ca2+-binding EF-hand superfamily protein